MCSPEAHSGLRATLARSRTPRVKNEHKCLLIILVVGYRLPASQGSVARARSGVPAWCDDVVDLQDHFDNLRGKHHLLFLPNERLENILLLHVIGSHLLAVHAEPAENATVRRKER